MLRSLILGGIAFLLSCPYAAAGDYKEAFVPISRGQASRIALTQMNGWIKNSDLDKRNGGLRWKVQVRNPLGGADVFIDAMTGGIYRVKYKD